jgi:FAD/FMN-containing dehydrogenase
MVTPGTKFVTIGGMIACDVHGKNHHRDGSFRQSVIEFSLIDGDGTVHTCSREINAELFDATLGGMGLTGIIRDAKLRLIPIESAFVLKTTERCVDLDQLFQTLERRKQEHYTVAWIDCSARGASLGRGLVFSGRHAALNELPPALTQTPLDIQARRKRRVPFTPPFDGLRRPVLVAFNALYYGLNTPGTALIDYDSYFYPLDAISDWNRVYGPKGFLQFQCVIPERPGQRVIRKMIELITNSGAGSPLAVLKHLGPGANHLSFPVSGYTLALDFPARRATLELQTRLNELVASEGGRLYFTKDATAAPSIALSGYPTDAFLSARNRIANSERFRSSLSRRIRLTT